MGAPIPAAGDGQGPLHLVTTARITWTPIWAKPAPTLAQGRGAAVSVALSHRRPYHFEGGEAGLTGWGQQLSFWSQPDSFPSLTLPLFYGTQAGNFASMNPSVKWGYHHPLLMGCSEHLNEK